VLRFSVNVISGYYLHTPPAYQIYTYKIHQAGVILLNSLPKLPINIKKSLLGVDGLGFPVDELKVEY